MRYWKFLAIPTLIAALLSIPRSAPAQVSINIGPEPVCPYGYYDFTPYDCAPYGYYGPEGFSGGVFIGAGSWFHAPTTSTATLITASIHIAATLVHIRTMETSPSITSTETRCVMDAATQVVEATARQRQIQSKMSATYCKGARLVGSGNNFPVADRLRSKVDNSLKSSDLKVSSIKLSSARQNPQRMFAIESIHPRKTTTNVQRSVPRKISVLGRMTQIRGLRPFCVVAAAKQSVTLQIPQYGDTESSSSLAIALSLMRQGSIFSWPCRRSKAVIVGSIQINMSGTFLLPGRNNYPLGR